MIYITYLINYIIIKQVLVELRTLCNNLKLVHNYKTVYKVTTLKRKI